MNCPSYSLKILNYLAASHSYWEKEDFLQKVGFLIFFIAYLFLNKLIKILYYCTHEKNYLFSDIEVKQHLFIVNGGNCN